MVKNITYQNIRHWLRQNAVPEVQIQEKVTYPDGTEVTTSPGRGGGGKGYANQQHSIPHASSTVIPFDVSEYDNTDSITVDTANNKIVIENDGVYSISANYGCGESLTDGTYITFGIRVNGANAAFSKDVLGAGAKPSDSVSVDKDLSQGDEITMFMYQTEGSSIALAASEAVNISVMEA